MTTFEQIIEWLSGKKTTIATILGAILVFAQGRQYIADDTAMLVSAILVALGLTSNYITTKYYEKKLP
jgi:hypothetical protein